MLIDNVQINDDLYDILIELKQQLEYNNIRLFHHIKDIGKDVQVCCPYHKEGQEKRPSAGIRKRDGLFHCFTCGEVHTLPEVISHCFGRNDNGIFGWQWLLRNYVTVEREDRNDIELNFGRTNYKHHSNSNNNSSGNLCRQTFISEEELDSYRYIHPYMYERKLNDEIIETFDIGYDKNTRCITFPVRDITGKTLFIARRSVVSKFFNYPQGVEKPLYGLYELTKQQERYSEIIVCESMLDALTVWVYGKVAVALNGLGNQLQFKQLRDLPARELILATDNDEAGQKARERIKKNVTNKIITQYDYDSFPEHAKDINDLSETEFKNLRKIF